MIKYSEEFPSTIIKFYKKIPTTCLFGPDIYLAYQSILVSFCNKSFFDSIFRSQNLVEEWLQKMPSLPTPASSSSEGGGATSAPSALNLSLNHSSRPIIQPAQYSRSSPGAFNNSNSNSMTHITTPKSASISGGSTPSQMDSLKSRAIRDIQLSHTKDMHGNQ